MTSSKTTLAVITKWANSIMLATEWTQVIVIRTLAMEDINMVTNMDSSILTIEKLKTYNNSNFKKLETEFVEGKIDHVKIIWNLLSKV